MGIDTSEFLRNVPIFSDCSAEERKAIAARVHASSFEPGQMIVVQDTPGYALYIIVNGRVRVVRDGVPVSSFGSGDFFGELSLLDEAPRSASVLAVESTSCLMLPGWDFATLLEEQPSIAVKLLAVLSKRLRETTGNQIA